MDFQNPATIKHFLPSKIRGVYRFDDELSKSKIHSDEEARNFVDLKLRFLPEEYRNIFKEYFDLEKITFNNLFGNRIWESTASKSGTRRKYSEYFDKHEHLRLKNENNYLEREFIKNILSPILSLNGLFKIQPQKQIAQYFVDFSVIGEKKYTFEVDGFGKFKDRANMDEFLERQNRIINNGWVLYRFSYSHIINKPEKTRKQIYDIFTKDSELKAYLSKGDESNLFEDSQIDKGHDNAIHPVDLVNNFYLIQDYITNAIIERESVSDIEIAIRDNLFYPFPLVAFSLSSLYRFFDSIVKLFALDFKLPHLKIISRYTEVNNQIHKKISLTDSNLTSDIEIDFDVINDPNLQARVFINDNVNINFDSLEVQDIKDYINYFTYSIFRYNEGTKLFQDKVIKHIFDGKDVLGISPTGSGKSFCFWLPTLLNPGLSIVICPLRSLMRDQLATLQNYGISSIAFINSDIRNEEQEQIVTDVLLGKVKLLYVAPERIRIKKFLDHLNKIQKFRKINYLVIDEAHCISEWGHDFRPSYLNIPSFYETLKLSNKDLQIIALTATAGGMIRKDIMNILNLKKESVISDEDFDRINFSYQIIPVKDYREKQEKFQKILTESIPKALRKEDIKAVVSSKNKQEEKNMGIIYTIYADPHGRYSIYDGISHYLYETKMIIEPDIFHERENDYALTDYGSNDVRAFSSKPPTLCPKCNSYQYISHRNTIDEEDYSEVEDSDEIPKGWKKCLSCGYKFQQTNVQNANKPPKYQEVTFKNQADFKKGLIDILVATKGFGMGIDKGSVRFVLHTSFASGIESWYQEAGRAGRDNERAHCVILAEIPEDNCIHQLVKIDEAKIPSCTNRGNCPYGRESLCDYGKQHVFIKKSYPSVEADIISIIRTLDKLIIAFLDVARSTINFQSSNSRLKSDELALFRLKVLGIVQEFSVFYVHRSPFFEVTLSTEITSDNKIALKLNTDEMVDKLIEYLKRNSLYDVPDIENPETMSKRIKRCKEKYDADVIDRIGRNNLTNYEKYQWFYHKIIDYLLVILDHTYTDIVKMRYQMLWHLHSVIWNRDKECRRPLILQYFQNVKKSYENYRCELCDVCIEDLNFKRESRIPPKETEVEEELQRQLEEALLTGHFVYESLVRLRDVFLNYSRGIYRRSSGILEGSPNNLVAVYFCREFSPKDEKEANTKRLIRTANEFLHMDTVIELYKSSENKFKKSQLLILDDEYGRFNNEDGIKWLHGEANKLLKSDYDKQLDAMRERFGFMFLCNEFDTYYSERFKDINQQIMEAYYG